METLRAKTPVFTDESGRRVTVLQWVARGLCACLVLVGAAIAIAMVTHVPLPGLGRYWRRRPRTARPERPVKRRRVAARPRRGPHRWVPTPAPSTIRGRRARRVQGQPTVAAATRQRRQRHDRRVWRPLHLRPGCAPERSLAAAAADGDRIAHPFEQPALAQQREPPRDSEERELHSASDAAATAKTKNPRATAGRSNGQSSSAPTSTPPGWTK